MTASSDIAKFAKKTNMAVDKFRRGVCLKLFSAVIMDTPVDTGRARASWNTSVGAIDNTVDSYDGGSKTVAAGLSINRIADNLGGINNTVFLHNPVGYIGYLEYGTTRFAGRYMVRRNVQRIKSILRRTK
jgi:hypothetical protein